MTPLTDTIKLSEIDKPPTTTILRYAKDDLYTNPVITSKRYIEEYIKMPMHSQWIRQRNVIYTIDKERCDIWLKCSHLIPETESLLCAAQEQTSATNYVRKKLWKMNYSLVCRLCKVKDETVSHIISGCTMLADTKYTTRYERVCTYVHWCLLNELGVKTCDEWYKHIPKESTECDDVTVMWDLTIQTDAHIPANRPDITIHDRKNKYATFIDISIPNDVNVIKKTAEKLVKYRDLEIEVQKCWGLRKVKTVPIIIGALGSVCTGQKQYLKELTKKIDFKILQKTALLGTANILRNVLSMNVAID